MMLPSAVPTLLLFGLVVRRDPARVAARLRVYIFAAGYLMVWGAFGAAHDARCNASCRCGP